MHIIKELEKAYTQINRCITKRGFLTNLQLYLEFLNIPLSVRNRAIKINMLILFWRWMGTGDQTPDLTLTKQALNLLS